MAGALAVALHDRLFAMRWLKRERSDDTDCQLTASGAEALEALRTDVDAARNARGVSPVPASTGANGRPHLAGAIGAELLHAALRRKWLLRDLDGRASGVTPAGKRELRARFGIEAVERQADRRSRSAHGFDCAADHVSRNVTVRLNTGCSRE